MVNVAKDPKVVFIMVYPGADLFLCEWLGVLSLVGMSVRQVGE